MRDYSCVGVAPDGLSVVVMDCGHARGFAYDEKKQTLTQNGKRRKMQKLFAILHCTAIPPRFKNPKKVPFENLHYYSVVLGKCLSVGSANNIYTSQMLPCREGDPLQKWKFTR